MTESSPKSPNLSPLEALANKEILILGTTGFLAKIVLSLLLERFSVKRIYVMIRETRSKTPDDRLWNEVMASEMIDPLREKFGDSFEALVKEQVVAIAGDLSKPGLGVDPEVFETLKPNLDLVVNSAGLVNFNPPLDNAVDANAIGAHEIAKFTKSLDKAKLVHVSTCYVAGARSGRIREDTPILGYFPKHDEFEGVEFDWARELKDLERMIEQVKDRTNDAALEATFKTEAIERLKKEKRDANPRTLRAAITNQRRRWLAEEQIRLGLERAKHWGWPNIYTYTKAIGEQAIAATEGLDWCIVRPAIVESAMSYPFPGWNEGMNTSAPLAYLGLHGQVRFPGTNDLILDVVPVDYVASAIIAAAAALVEGETEKVYQVAAGDINPCTMARTVTLVGVYRRRKIKKKKKDGEIGRLKAEWQMRGEPVPVNRKSYQRLGAPALQGLLRKTRSVIDELEPERYGPLGGVLSRAQKSAKDMQGDIDKVVDAFDLFMPFIWENKYVFRTPQTRDLFARMNEADQSLFPAWDIEGIDWRHYWLDVHLPGLEEYVFPKLETTGPKRLQISRDYRDLVELFASRTKEHGRRVAYRMLKNDDVADSFTYRDVRRGARGVAEFLKQQGVKKGDRVLIVSEGRPEWGMSYFGIILAGATAVPVDVDLSLQEITNIARAASAKGVIASDKQIGKLTCVDVGEGEAVPAIDAPVWSFEQAFASAHEIDPSEDVAGKVKRKPEDIASIIFTSGTTGKPKGVVLTDRNFTALTARMNALFELNRTDSLLSVLPPHHTFEFSAGMLMPLAAGASVTYIEERTPELISRAFEETPVSALIGVPAVWESLHRKLMKEVEALPVPAEFLVKSLMRLNRWVRDRSGFNFGRWVFRPMHDAVGGRMRYMVSGAAALKSNIYTDFRGIGFSMYEGYGLTEASPVLTVGWPRMKNEAGSVGWPLPGIEVRIDGKNDDGVGEIIARGPTIMQGYLDNEEATQRALQSGWLRTGDRGRLDEEGRLFIVGREKDVIIDTGGKNVYPDEIEELYAGCELIKELSVVGVPAENGNGERVAALVVPDYEAGEAMGITRDETRERVRDHFKDVGSKLPFARRVKILHTWEGELPRTSTRKVRRPLVQAEIIRLEHTLHAARDAEPEEVGAAPEDTQRSWVRRTVAAIANKKVDEISTSSSLVDGLGFDSLMQLELLTALESEFPQARIDQDEMANAETVADVLRLVSRDLSGMGEHTEDVGHQEEERPLQVPRFVSDMGKAALGFAQRMSYELLLEVDVEGEGNIPANRNFIVASNHASHLDMGLVKYALGAFGRDIRTLAAKDYFFDDPYRRTYFENFTNLLPMDRHGSLKRSLRMASEAIRNGERLLIFPEGTRARDGKMVSFKPAIGHLCLVEKVDVLPLFLGGTHEALPVGAALPKDRSLWVKIGDPITPERMREETKGMSKSAAYRHVAWRVEQSVRKMGGLPPPEPPEGRFNERSEAQEAESAS